MRTPSKNKNRESRILDEVVVDAHDEEERAMGWYYYLEDKMTLPCSGRCREAVSTSPLHLGEEVELVSMAEVEVCGYNMFVTVNWGSRRLDVPLLQIEAIDADGDTQEAIEDWHYWNAQGYQF